MYEHRRKDINDDRCTHVPVAARIAPSKSGRIGIGITLNTMISSTPESITEYQSKVIF